MLRWWAPGVTVAGLVLALLGAPAPRGAVSPAQAADPELPELSPEAFWPGVPLPDPPPQVSVKLRGAPGPGRLAAMAAGLGADVLRTNELTGVHTLHVPPGADPEAFAARLARDPRVEWAEPVRLRRLAVGSLAPITPNDTFYANNQRWYYEAIRATEGWNVTTGSASVVIAVIDSGVMCTHTDLAANMWVNPREIPNNGLDDDGNGYVDDVYGYDFVGTETGNLAAPNHPGDSDPCIREGDTAAGNGVDDDGSGSADEGVTHGTFVAGVAAAVGNNAKGVTGMCWSCKIMAVRVANPEGWLRSSDTADAITYAALNGAKVINLSLGGPQVSQAEVAAINLAISNGVTVIAASGNENRTPIAYPARLANVLSVGASGHANLKGRAPFSNWGAGTVSNPAVDVVAPGEDIASTAVRSMADQNAGRGQAGSETYFRGSGTSFSTPLVAGLVGLMLTLNPALTPTQVRAIINQTASPLPDDPADSPNAGPTWAGSGMVDALAALSAVSGVPAPTPTPGAGAPTPSPTPLPVAPTPTPLPRGSIPMPVAPPSGTVLSDLGTTLYWNFAADTTQYQLQVIPANNDGPAINLIRNVENSYAVLPPVFGTGPYVMLPGMTYTWRIRTTTATTPVDEQSPSWGPWSAAFTFRTRAASSSTVSAVSPSPEATVSTLTPVLQWADRDLGIFYYEVQLSKDPTFNTDPATATAMVYWALMHGAITTPPNSYAVPASFPLEPGTLYHWRVRPRIQGDGTPAAWSPTFRFRTP